MPWHCFSLTTYAFQSKSMLLGHVAARVLYASLKSRQRLNGLIINGLPGWYGRFNRKSSTELSSLLVGHRGLLLSLCIYPTSSTLLRSRLIPGRHDCRKVLVRARWSFACSHPIFELQKIISRRNNFSLSILTMACPRTTLSRIAFGEFCITSDFVQLMQAGLEYIYLHTTNPPLDYPSTDNDTSNNNVNSENLLVRSASLSMRQVAI